MERHCSVLRGYTPGVVLLLLAVILESQTPACDARELRQAPRSQQLENQKGSGSQESGGIAMVQSGLKSVQEHTASVEEKSLVKYSSCLRQNQGSTSPEITSFYISLFGAATHSQAVNYCSEECRKRPECGHFTLNVNTRWCYLKQGLDMKLRGYYGDMTWLHSLG